MPKNKIRIQVNGNQCIDIKVAKNQKVVKIVKSKPKGYILDIAANKKAMSLLSPQAYLLYMHFVLNVPDYTEALSSKLIMEQTSLSERHYYKAVNELIEKNYLVKTDHLDYEDYYLLYESP